MPELSKIKLSGWFGLRMNFELMEHFGQGLSVYGIIPSESSTTTKQLKKIRKITDSDTTMEHAVPPFRRL
jgi:hypothetical protein